MDWNKKIKIKTDDLVVYGVLALLGIAALSSYYGGIGGIVNAFQQVIIAIAGVNLQTSFYDLLYEPTTGISPIFYVWREGATEPTQYTVTGGSRTVRLAPEEKITWAAGSYGCDEQYYWEKEEFAVGTADTPKQVQLVAVPRCTDVSIKIFDSSYHDLTNGRYNMSVSAGEDVDLEVTLDVTGEYFAIKRPHICVDYNTADVNRVKISGLEQVSPPTRIISSLDQCFDTGLGYYNYSDTRLRYGAKIDAVTGQSISTIHWYVIDQDLWWKDGELYFVNPLTREDMGAGTGAGVKWDGTEWIPKGPWTCVWNATTYFE